MSMLSESNRRAVSDRLTAMEHPVRLVIYPHTYPHTERLFHLACVQQAQAAPPSSPPGQCPEAA